MYAILWVLLGPYGNTRSSRYVRPTGRESLTRRHKALEPRTNCAARCTASSLCQRVPSVFILFSYQNCCKFCHIVMGCDDEMWVEWRSCAIRGVDCVFFQPVAFFFFFSSSLSLLSVRYTRLSVRPSVLPFHNGLLLTYLSLSLCNPPHFSLSSLSRRENPRRRRFSDYRSVPQLPSLYFPPPLLSLSLSLSLLATLSPNKTRTATSTA